MSTVPPVDAPVWCEVCQTETVTCAHLCDSDYLGEELSRLHRLADMDMPDRPYAGFSALIDKIDCLQERHHRLTRRPGCDCHLCRDRGWFDEDEACAAEHWRSLGMTYSKIVNLFEYSKSKGQLRGFRQRLEQQMAASPDSDRHVPSRLTFEEFLASGSDDWSSCAQPFKALNALRIRDGIANPDGSDHGPNCICSQCVDWSPDASFDDEYFFVIDGVGTLVVGYREIPDLLAQFPNARRVKK